MLAGTAKVLMTTRPTQTSVLESLESAAVSGVTPKARLAGLIVDKKEVGAPGEFESMKADELEAALAKEMAALGLTVSRPYARHSVKQPMVCVPPPKIAWLLGFNEVSAFYACVQALDRKDAARDANSGRLLSAMG